MMLILTVSSILESLCDQGLHLSFLFPGLTDSMMAVSVKQELSTSLILNLSGIQHSSTCTLSTCDTTQGKSNSKIVLAEIVRRFMRPMAKIIETEIFNHVASLGPLQFWWTRLPSNRVLEWEAQAPPPPPPKKHKTFVSWIHNLNEAHAEKNERTPKSSPQAPESTTHL